MPDKHEIRWLSKRLLARIHAAGVRLFDVSQELGHSPNYLTRCFRGGIPLKVQTVFEILHALRLEPWELFEDAYPFGGAVLQGLARQAPGREESLRELRAVLAAARHERERAPPAPAEWTARTRRVLRDLRAGIGSARRAPVAASGWDRRPSGNRCAALRRSAARISSASWSSAERLPSASSSSCSVE